MIPLYGSVEKFLRPKFIVIFRCTDMELCTICLVVFFKRLALSIWCICIPRLKITFFGFISIFHEAVITFTSKNLSNRAGRAFAF